MPKQEVNIDKIIEKLGDPFLNRALFDDYIERLKTIKSV
jgi:hypothetical protein